MPAPRCSAIGRIRASSARPLCIQVLAEGDSGLPGRPSSLRGSGLCANRIRNITTSASAWNRVITMGGCMPSVCHTVRTCPPGWGGEVRILSGALREPRRCLGGGRRTEWDETAPPGRMADGWKVTGAVERTSVAWRRVHDFLRGSAKAAGDLALNEAMRVRILLPDPSGQVGERPSGGLQRRTGGFDSRTGLQRLIADTAQAPG